MVFSSLLFLFRFLPVAFLLYYLTPPRFRNLLLIVESLIFYSWGEVRYFPIMLASVAVDYIASGIIEAHRGQKGWCRAGLILSMVFNLGMLGFFKYSGFLAQNLNALTGLGLPVLNLTLPLGISFYTFQTMSYTIDVYRGKVHAERNLIDFAAFVVLFPQLIAGPIVRYTDISRELKTRVLSLDQIESGIELFLLGLASKVLLANNIGALWTEIEGMDFSSLAMPVAWLGVLAYALQIYFDFSGYSLMAIGLGKMLGFEFPQNFNYPYISRSITEFWRRWHITMGSWFREYLYIPLGGNRKGKVRQFFNLFLVWAATGLWHGASWNFVCWGLYFFLFLMLEKWFLLPVLDKRPVFSHFYAMLLVLIGWAIFAITDFSRLGSFLQSMVSFRMGGGTLYYLRNYGISILLGILFSTPLPKRVYEKAKTGNMVCRGAALACLLLTVLCSVAYLVDATYNPFLYFRF